MEPENLPAEQPLEDSVEDRIADILSPGEQPQESQAAPDTEPTEEVSEPAEETFELEYEGEKYQLPKRLEKAIMQERDYTQKSQSLAEMRKDVERQFAQIKLAQSESQFQQSVKTETDQMAMIDAVLAEYGKLEWAKLGTDELVRKKLEMDQYRDMRAALDQQVHAKRAQFEQTYKQELDKLRTEANETLKKRVNWSDETETKVRAYVRELGITDAEYDAVFDPRHKQILWEAAQYRELKGKAQPVAQQVKAVKTTSNSPMPQPVKEKLNFRKAMEKTASDPVARRAVIESRVEQLFR
jgi:hypothetical protein